MKTALRIAGTELRTIFYSPIAWFVLIVFLIQSGIIYFSLVDSVAVQQEMGGVGLRYIFNLMGRIFNGKNGLFVHVMENLYLYIPLLTMGLISRETSSGTIKLLFSSPIKVRQIVLGKYLAMVLYSLLLVAIVALFVATGISHVQDADKGMLITALVGFYLLLCTYSAIGLFMSCLTTYQMVAAVSTFVMVAVLSYIGSVWQSVEFVRDITYFLSISGRTEKMLRGLITTKDVIYFLSIIYIFLGLSIYKLKSGMESKTALVKAGGYFAVVASGIIIGYVSSMPFLVGYLDASANKVNTLRPNVQKIVAELGDDPLEITTYNNVLGSEMMMGLEKNFNAVKSTWEPYMRFKKGHNIIVNKTVNYYDSTFDNPYMMQGYVGKSLREIAQQLTKVNGIDMDDVKSPEEIKKTIDLRPESNKFVMQLKYKGRTTFLRIFNDQNVWPSETEIAVAFRRLTLAKMPRVAFLTGNLERSIVRRTDREYMRAASAKSFRYSLTNQGFDVDTITLETQDVAANIDILVIGDPKLEMTSVALDRLKKYIDRGGNLLITCEPGKGTLLQPVFDGLGVRLMEGQLLQQDKDYLPDQVHPNFAPALDAFSKQLAEMRKDSMAMKTVMQGVAGFTYADHGAFTIKPLLTSDPQFSWNRVKELDPDMMTSAMGPGYNGPAMMMADSKEEDTSARNGKPGKMVKPTGKPTPAEAGKKTGPPTSAHTNANISNPSTEPPIAGMAPAPRATGVVQFSPEDGDTRGTIPVALSLNRKVNGKEQRIVLVGDADFMKTGSTSQPNFIFTTSLFSWLSNSEYPIDSFRPTSKDTALNVTTDGLKKFRILYLWVMPGLLVAFAAILLIRRKRK